MYLLNEIVKILSSPVWSGIGVLASVLLSVIALVLARKSPSQLNASQQEPLIAAPSTFAPSSQDQMVTSSPRTSTPQPKRKRKNRSKSHRWIDDYDLAGDVPDAFLPPSYWN
jgi:negative regulator of sigma E activity